MCRRWRELPKPTIAMVQGACIAGGLMLAWVCDLIVASDDAFFADPVVKMGIPGVEYFAHPMRARPAHRQGVPVHRRPDRPPPAAYELGMVNRVVPRTSWRPRRWNWRAASRRCPASALALTKKAVNQVEDLMGLQAGMDSVFGLHHLAHAHNAEVSAATRWAARRSSR